MKARVWLTQVCLIFACSFFGYLGGEYLRSVESTLSNHQSVFYFNMIPKLGTLETAALERESKKLRMQLISLVLSAAGFLYGTTLVLKIESKKEDEIEMLESQLQT